MQILSDFIIVSSGQASFEALGFVVLGLFGVLFFWLMLRSFKIHILLGLALLTLELWLGFAFWLPAMIELGNNMMVNPTY